MPRSFLVRKSCTNKKPRYWEPHSEVAPLSPPQVQLPLQGYISPLTCYITQIFPSDSAPLATPTPSILVPVDLRSCCSSSSSPSSSSEGEEDGDRTSDPPSPDVAPPLYHCRCCSKSYKSAKALAAHQLQLQHHPQQQQQQQPQQPQLQFSRPPSPCPPPEPSDRPLYPCNHCAKEYSSVGALKMHIRSHTLPCVCSTCGKAFSRPWLLRGHMRTHTGERPFACPHCSRAFADRSNLRAHLQTHSQVKKYQCGTCSRTFSRMSLLHKHNASAGCCPPS